MECRATWRVDGCNTAGGGELHCETKHGSYGGVKCVVEVKECDERS